MGPEENQQYLEQIEQASAYIKSKLPQGVNPSTAIICGSGLGGLASTLAEPLTIQYNEIPHFVTATVSGHEGKLVIGNIGQQTVLCMVGRFHFYEGHHLRQVTFPVRVFAKLGVKNLIVTNAAGGLNTSFEVGNVMVIGDHFTLAGLAGLNPLLGPNLEDFGPRFPSTSDAYNMDFRKLAFQAADKLEGKPLKLVEGTYTFVSGPSYETRAEGRLLRTLGADAVGMSTVPEVIVAKHCGMKILGLSLITNVVVTTASSVFEEEKKEVHATHQEVLEASIIKAQAMQGLVREIVSNF